MTDQGKSLAVRSSSELAQVEELEGILLGGKVPDVVDDPETIAREIVAQLLSASTDEELEAMGSATGWRDLEGVPVRIAGFSWRPSGFTEGAPIYFVVQAERLDTAERVVLTTGSMNVLAQLTNMAKRGTLVGAVRELVRADKPTAAGFYPLWLKTPDKRGNPLDEPDGEPMPEQARASAA